MRIEDMLDSCIRGKLNKLRVKQVKKKTVKKDNKVQYQEKLSDRDLENLMGVHRPRYYKDRGSYRQR